MKTTAHDGPLFMPARRKKEKIVGAHFIWLLGQRNGLWAADGRTNRLNPGRHSLGTRDYDEAVRALSRLDMTMAVKFGLINSSELKETANDALSFEEGIRLYLDHVRRPRLVGGAAPKTPRRYQAVFDKAVPYFKKLGYTAWNQIKKRQLEDYVSWLDGEGYAYRTEFLEITTIKQAFNFWTDPESGHLPPECRLKMRLRKPTGTDTYCWRPAEVQAIVGHCKKKQLDWLGDVVVALICTGMRISELASLKWTDIDLHANMVMLKDESHSRRVTSGHPRTTKSRRDRAFPIHKDLRALLEAKHTVGKGGPIFTGPHGGVLRPDALRQALVKRVLLPLADRFPSTDEVGFKDGRLHSCRHYFCSMCANNGVPEQVVMRWLGHQASAMVRHYYHLYDDEAQRQMQKLTFFGGTDAS